MAKIERPLDLGWLRGALLRGRRCGQRDLGARSTAPNSFSASQQLLIDSDPRDNDLLMTDARAVQMCRARKVMY
jgi:hypothetical protein